MFFNLISMKQRASHLLKTVKPGLLRLGAVYTFIPAICLVLLVIYPVDSEETDIFYIIPAVLYAFLLIFIASSSSVYGLKAAREEKVVFSDAFYAFKKSGLSITAAQITKLVLCAFSLPYFIVGAFVPLFFFRFVVVIAFDEKCNPFKAMKINLKIMKGHYAELIKIDLSNIGWFALMILSLGFAGIYVVPYLAILYGEYYDCLKAQYALFNESNQ